MVRLRDAHFLSKARGKAKKKQMSAAVSSRYSRSSLINACMELYCSFLVVSSCLLLSTSLAYFNLSFPLKISSSRCLPTLELSWSHKRFQWIQSVRLPQGRRAPLLFKVKCWIWKRIVPLSGGFLIPVVYNWPIFPLSWFPTLSSTFAK